jgi:hypothetical protein
MLNKFILLISATVATVKAVQLQAEGLDNSDLASRYQRYTIPNIRSQIRAEIADALTDENWWDWVPRDIREAVRPVA